MTLTNRRQKSLCSNAFRFAFFATILTLFALNMLAMSRINAQLRLILSASETEQVQPSKFEPRNPVSRMTGTRTIPHSMAAKTAEQSTAETPTTGRPTVKVRHASMEGVPTICTNEDCRSEYVKRFQVPDTYPIPAVRHILWRNESVSKYFADQLATWYKIHPDWTFVLWRDRDLEPFVRSHFPGLLDKFKSLKQHIMRVDMIRYMILYKFGGVYADLDYSLVSSLDAYRKFHAIVTREPEAHSLDVLGMSWPVKVLANPAFMMSAPGHVFFYYAMQQLATVQESRGPLDFAGAAGLSKIMENYQRVFPVPSSSIEAVYVPPSYSFYPYQDNRLLTSKIDGISLRAEKLERICKEVMSSGDKKLLSLKRSKNLSAFCTDVNNMDPITDTSQPVIAVHDLRKRSGIWWGTAGQEFYMQRMVDIRTALATVTLGSDFMNEWA